MENRCITYFYKQFFILFLMELKEAKLLKGRLAGTRMDWLCAEIEEVRGSSLIICMDVTNPGNMRRVFVVPKGQPPGEFDFFPEAYKSFEQIWFAQNVVHEWDKLEDGNVITAGDEALEKIRMWHGKIYTPGACVTVRRVGDVNILEREEFERDIGRAKEAPSIILPDEETYDIFWRRMRE